MSEFSDWIGRRRVRVGETSPWACQALHASIDSLAPPPTTELPLPWHWLYCLEINERRSLGPDGHAAKGDFIPPIAQPRRMFVGGRSRQRQALHVGKAVTLEESILSCEDKRGEAGDMVLLTIAGNYLQDGNTCVEEERDFMYLPARGDKHPEPTDMKQARVPGAPLAWDLVTDPVLLFRFSALTFNSHRIHYDRTYARETEGYPDLVVHGPLIALLLAELARWYLRRPPESFSFRARAPVFVGDRLRLRGEPGNSGRIALSAYRPDGVVAMTAEAS